MQRARRAESVADAVLLVLDKAIGVDEDACPITRSLRNLMNLPFREPSALRHCDHACQIASSSPSLADASRRAEGQILRGPISLASFNLDCTVQQTDSAD